MKKIIAIVTIGASFAFLQVQAQEAPQTERTQDTQSASAQSPSKRVKIDKSQLPPEVLKSLEEGEYKDMEIVSVYEVTADDGSTSYELVTDDASASAGAIDSTEVYPDGQASNEVEEPTVVGDTIPDEASARVMEEASGNQEVDTATTEGIIDKAKEGVVNAYEEVKEFIVGEDTTAVADTTAVGAAPAVEDTTAVGSAAQETQEATNEAETEVQEAAQEVEQETEETAQEVEQETEETANEVGNTVEETASEAVQETEEAANTVENKTENAVDEVEEEVQETAQEVDNATDDMSENVDETANQTEEAIEEAPQEIDNAVDTDDTPNESASNYNAPAEDQPEDMMSETESTDKATATGVPVTAQAPQTEDDGMQTVAGDTTSTEELGEQLYDDNQYTTQHDAVESAYADMDEDKDPSKPQTKQKKEYEIDVRGDNENVKLYYNEQGELVKVDKSDM